MKLKTLFISVLATLCMGMSACTKDKSEKPVESVVSELPIDSEEPIDSELPVDSEDPIEPSSEPVHEHVFGEWATVTEPTCTEKGLEERVCECGEKEQHELDALGHLPKAEWEVVKESTVDEEGEEVLKCERCNAVLETRKIDKLTPPEPALDPIVLTAADLMGYSGTNIAYKDGEGEVGGVKFNYIECGAYGNGIQMRTKNGKSSTIYNVDALPGAVKSVKISLNSGKKVYANEHALTFSFGSTAECADKSITWDTVADTLSYEFEVGTENCTYFKLVHSITYSLYVDAIELIF